MTNITNTIKMTKWQIRSTRHASLNTTHHARQNHSREFCPCGRGTASRPHLGPPTAGTHRSKGREHLGGSLPHAQYDMELVRWRPPPWSWRGVRSCRAPSPPASGVPGSTSATPGAPTSAPSCASSARQCSYTWNSLKEKTVKNRHILPSLG